MSFVHAAISGGLAVLCLGAGPAPRTAVRPGVDPEAMREAMRGAGGEGAFKSSASYAHFLGARMAHHAGDHRAAVQELILALATDDANPFLLTTLAEEYARLSELGRAERELKKALEADPRYHPAQLMMGRVLMDGGKVTRAQGYLKRAISLRPSDPEAYLVLAQLQLDRQALAEAVETMEALGQAVPGEAIGYRRLGLVLAERGENARALTLLTKAVDRDPGDFESWVTLAQLYVSSDRLTEAEEAYSRALERDPDNSEVLLAAGRLALKNGSVVRARACFDRLLGISDDPQLVVQVAFTYLAAKETEAAAEALELAKGARQEEPRVAFYAGLVHERLRRFGSAATAFGEVPSHSELFHEARLHQALALSAVGQHPRAQELLWAGLKERPDYLALYPAYARALERGGKGAEAEQFLSGALQKRGDAELFEALSRHLVRQGRHPEAVAVLRRGLEKFPREEGLLFTLGATYERQGDLDRGLAAMREVLAVNPENPMALNYLGYLLADHGRELETAEKLLNKAVALKPDSGEYLDSLGWLYYRRGNHALAVSTLEKAARLSPREPVILEHLGDAYLEVSRIADAEQVYRRALEALAGADEEQVNPAELRSKLEKKLRRLSQAH